MSSEPDPAHDALSEETREAVAALADLGKGLDELQQMSDEQFQEIAGLMETLGHEDEADALRSTRRDLLKAAGVAAAGIGAGAAGGMAATGGARADPDSTEEGTFGNGDEDWEIQDLDGNHADLNSIETDYEQVGRARLNDLSRYNPHMVDSWEQGGPPLFRPYQGISQPVLSAGDVSDVSDAEYVADPCLVYEPANDGSDPYHMFFEIQRTNNPPTAAHATSPDGLHWNYDQEVDIKPYTLRKWDGTWYAYQEDTTSGGDFGIWSLDLDALSFTKEAQRDPGIPVGDIAAFPWESNGQLNWFAFVYEDESGDGGTHVLVGDDHLFTNITEPSYSEVTSSPLNGPAGHPIVHDDVIDLPVMNDSPADGNKAVDLYRVTELTPTSYTHTEVAKEIIGPNSGSNWSATAMHHIYPVLGLSGGRDLYAVDGFEGGGAKWTIGIYTLSEIIPHATVAHTNIDITIDTNTGGAVQDITLNVRTIDYPTAWDRSNGTWTCPESGLWRLTFSVQFGDISNSPHIVRALLRNETTSTYLADEYSHVSVNSQVSVNCERTVYVGEGDVIQPKIAQDSGGSVKVNGGSQAPTEFAAFRVW